MFEIGDRVVCIETLGYDGLTVGKVYTVDSLWNPGIWVVDDKGVLVGMCSEYFKPYTETEAERRGAKFGMTGVIKITGRKIRFVADDGKKSINGQPLWVFLNEETQSIMRLCPSDVRFDHEQEYVAWEEAPEHLKYDASRVYWKGEPVKWIAKPEGANVNVAFTRPDGQMEFTGYHLTVKL